MTYNHEKENLESALGYEEGAFKTMLDKINAAFAAAAQEKGRGLKASETVEVLDKTLTKDGAIILVFLLKAELDEVRNPLDMIAQLMASASEDVEEVAKAEE